MDTFPVLNVGPSALEFVVKPAINPTYRSEFENGMVLTRARTTRVPKLYEIKLRGLSQTDKNILETFITDTVHYGAKSFTWENPQTGVAGDNKTVRFLADTIEWKIVPPPEFPQGNPDHWDVEFTLEEV